jgi:replicative DNA helicase
MGIKIVSVKAELAVLRGLCNKDKKISAALLGSIDESYFYNPESIEIYSAVKKHMAEHGEPPTYRLLLEDPDLSEEARSHFRNSTVTISTVEDANKAARILGKYRQTRGLYNLASNINDALNSKKKFKLDELLETTATNLNIIRAKKSNKNCFLHFGRNNNSKGLIEDILYGDNSEDVIPTGIKAYDDVSGGFLRGSLVTLGANSGGGKSCLANAIAIKMATRGYKVLMVPLEMSLREMSCRTMANVSKMNLTKIILQKLATGEKEYIYKKQRRWEQKVKQAGGRYTLFKPQEDMSIEEIIAATSAYQSDVVIIDYISLLKGVDGDDMWRALGAVARYAKINAEIENRVNILLCQVSTEGVIRYARSISEHSSNSWVWVATKETKADGIIRIEQPKSRNSQSFPFTVKMDYEFMRVTDVSQNESLGPVTNDSKKEPIPNLAESDI